MTTLLPLTNIFAIPVPDDVQEFRIANGPTYWISYYHNDDGFLKDFGPLIPLPPGNWQYLFTSKDCTEEEAGKVVESERKKQIDRLYSTVCYKNYKPEKLQYWYTTALESLHSLLRANGLTPEKNNYAILKKEE